MLEVNIFICTLMKREIGSWCQIMFGANGAVHHRCHVHFDFTPYQGMFVSPNRRIDKRNVELSYDHTGFHVKAPRCRVGQISVILSKSVGTTAPNAKPSHERNLQSQF